MTKQDFTEAGFITTLDPQFRYEYDLSDPDEDYEESGGKPALLWDNVMAEFCITDGEQMFIYFNAESPAEAIEWANKVKRFEPN